MNEEDAGKFIPAMEGTLFTVRINTSPPCEAIPLFESATAGFIRCQFRDLPDCFVETADVIERSTGSVVDTYVFMKYVRKGDFVTIKIEPSLDMIHRMTRALMLGDDL